MIYYALNTLRSNLGYYRAEVRYKFSPLKVYRFAFSLLLDTVQTPAVAIQNGYALRTGGRIEFCVSLYHSPFISMSWANLIFSTKSEVKTMVLTLKLVAVMLYLD